MEEKEHEFHEKKHDENHEKKHEDVRVESPKVKHEIKSDSHHVEIKNNIGHSNLFDSESSKSGKGEEFLMGKGIMIVIGVLAVLLIFNQFQISGISNNIGSETRLDISSISQITTTSQAVALLFPVYEIQNEQDAIDMMISQGTPDYGAGMGISFDDPVAALGLLANNYDTIKADIKKNNPDVWERYLNLATKPVGISCEFCCGVGPIGITKDGELKCGCKHNPAAQAITMLLMKDTDYNDAEVLREVLKWKTLFYPKDMVNLALKASGGEIETELPGMVGGC